MKGHPDSLKKGRYGFCPIGNFIGRYASPFGVVVGGGGNLADQDSLLCW